MGTTRYWQDTMKKQKGRGPRLVVVGCSKCVLVRNSVNNFCDAIIKDYSCNHKKIGIFFKSGRPRRARSRPKEPSKQACVSRTARFCVSRGRRWGGGAAVCADVRDFRKWAENRSLAGPLNFLAPPSTERYSKKIGLECGPGGHGHWCWRAQRGKGDLSERRNRPVAPVREEDRPIARVDRPFPRNTSNLLRNVWWSCCMKTGEEWCVWTDGLMGVCYNRWSTSSKRVLRSRLLSWSGGIIT